MALAVQATADSIPDAFIFTDQTGVAFGTVVTSNAITVTGISASALISMATSAGSYSVSTDGGATWSPFSRTTPATVNLNDKVKVRLTSSTSYSTTKRATLTIGGISDTFSVTTKDNAPIPNFNTNVNYSANYTLDFNASASTCPAGYTCTYSWDFDNNGSSDASGLNATKTFAGTGPYPVTLTATAGNGTSASVTKNVTAVAINAAPVVCNAGQTYNGLQFKFDDCSTDAENSATVFVNWGDGKPVQSYALGQNAITHTYSLSGTYSITHWVQDSGGLKSSESVTVIVPTKRKVTVTALGDGTGEALSAPLASALVRVYKAGVLKAQGYTTASGAYTSPQVVEPGGVTITITKTGKTIDCDAVTGGAQSVNVPVTNITAATDGTMNCKY